MKTFKDNYFRVINFDTKYSSTGDKQLALHSRACFSDIFCLKGDRNYHIKYNIYVYTNGERYRQGYNNRCFLTLNQVISYLEEGKLYHDFQYTITSSQGHYIIHLNLTGLPIVHKFILTYIRYLYEMPFSFYLYEAFKLKQELPELQNETYLNIYNLVSATIPATLHGCDIHNIGASFKFKELLSIETINTWLQDYHYALNELYGTYANDSLLQINYDFGDRHGADISFWSLKSNRKKRYKTYLSNYKTLKQLK